MKEKVFKMSDDLKEILRENQYFEEVSSDRFIPEYLGLMN